jgi:AbrB family looped-hinge helix DNA binding protein
MKVSEKGQITIPKSIRDRFGITKNTKLDFKVTDTGILIIKQAPSKNPFEKLVGILNQPGSSDEYIEDVRGR